MKQFIEDATVSLKLSGIVKDMYPDLTKDQIKEISHHVYHRVNMSPVYDQARELINTYVHEELNG